MINQDQIFIASPPNNNLDFAIPPEATDIFVQAVDEREITLRSIETLRILMLADITVESKVPGVESHVRPAFTDKEIELLKSKIFKLISKI